MFTAMHELEFMLRLIVAAVCGSLIGIEREKRQKSAGLRTHIVVAVASALMMIVSKYGFFDVVMVDGLQADVSRIAAGVVSAIGFIGGGVIFIRRDNLVGLTTAAGLWATVGVGIAIGAGMYIIGVFSTLFIVSVQMLLHWKKVKVVSSTAGNIQVNLTKNNITMDQLYEEFHRIGIYVRNQSLSRADNGDILFKASIAFAKKETMADIVDEMQKNTLIDIIDIYTLA